ncbi:O-antigen ligase family protein [Veillonella sp.]|uniref:O-antigen ligase family protein n=1 Tax=Veillonella sp. TaxID=1926307 RepID=UPI0025D055DA|nr:O-antigen ligase family protein [Veillonella sp.]
MKLNITAIADRMIWFITLIFLVLSLTISFALGDANYGAYVLFVCLFGLIVFYLIREQGVIKFKLTSLHAYMLLFISACYLSTINAIEPSVAFSRSFDIVKIFFMLIILYMCYQDKKSVDTLLKIGMWTGYIVCFYTVYFYGLDYFITVLSSSARIANDALNANTVGLLGANAIVMTLYYMLYDRPRWWNIIALPTLGILAATGSRKALVFVVVGTVLLFIFRSLRSANVVNSIAKIIGSLLALTIVGVAVLQLPMFSEVLDRMSSMIDAFSGTGGDSSTIIRLALVDIGWDLFYQSPITGVGVNNPSVYTFFLYGKENYYLHNNYIELLAGTGVIGLLAYYSMYIYIAYNLIRYRDFHSNEYVMVLILFLSQIVMDMGMVSYESKSTYFYMMIFYLEVQLLRKGHNNEAQQIV